MSEDPYGDSSEYAGTESEVATKRPYTIQHGKPGDSDSEEEQGKRAAHHLARIRQAYRLHATRVGALKALCEMYEADLAKAKEDLASAERDRDKECWIDRALLSAWTATAPQFTDPSEPRNGTLVFGDMALDVRSRTVPEKLTLTDEEAVMRQCPGYVEQKPKLLWADLKKTLTPTPHGVITPDGEIIEGVVWTPKDKVDASAVLLDGKRIPLKVEGETPEDEGDNTDAAE